MSDITALKTVVIDENGFSLSPGYKWIVRYNTPNKEYSLFSPGCEWIVPSCTKLKYSR